MSQHFVLHTPLQPPFPKACKMMVCAMGCFWGVERLFWKEAGVYSTHVGYAGGARENPSYEQVCAGGSGHAEVVRVVYYPEKISFAALLALFWENHDPTQGMRQGNDVGSQYRSGLYLYEEEELAFALSSKDMVQDMLSAKGFGGITTEITKAPVFYYAEGYHQQYLAKNPDGYCSLSGTGIACELV